MKNIIALTAILWSIGAIADADFSTVHITKLEEPIFDCSGKCGTDYPNASNLPPVRVSIDL